MEATQLEPLTHSPEAAARRLGTNVRAIYTAISNGELRSFKLGRQRRIPDTELQRLVQRKLADGA